MTKQSSTSIPYRRSQSPRHSSFYRTDEQSHVLTKRKRKHGQERHSQRIRRYVICARIRLLVVTRCLELLSVPDLTEPSARIWGPYLELAEKYDKDLVDSWRDDMESLLIFVASLFTSIYQHAVANSPLRVRRLSSPQVSPRLSSKATKHCRKTLDKPLLPYYFKSLNSSPTVPLILLPPFDRIFVKILAISLSTCCGF